MGVSNNGRKHLRHHISDKQEVERKVADPRTKEVDPCYFRTTQPRQLRASLLSHPGGQQNSVLVTLLSNYTSHARSGLAAIGACESHLGFQLTMPSLEQPIAIPIQVLLRFAGQNAVRRA